MPDDEIVEERHPLRATDEARDRGRRRAQRGRRQLADRPPPADQVHPRRGARPVRGAARAAVAGSLGPLPQNSLSQTIWNGDPAASARTPPVKPLRLMRDPEITPIKAEDVTIGSVFHVMPQGLLPDPVTGDGGTPNLLEAKAKAAVILMRLDEDIIESQKQRDWGYDGIVAYSKICTHVGCPISPVRAADAPPALPVPPVDLRPGRRRRR